MALAALLAATALIAPVGGSIDATGEHLAYSRPDGEGYRLVIDGKDAPVAPERATFSVDLGTDARGRLVAVYARQPGFSTELHALDVATGRERLVPGTRGTDRDEVEPSVSRGRVLFGVRGLRDGLRITSLAGGRERRLPIPPKRRPGCSEDRCEELLITGTELAGGVLAYTALEGDGSDSARAQLWFARVGRSPRLLARGVNSVNQATDLFAPQISSKWVTAAQTREGEGGDGSRLIRVSPGRGTVQRATVPDVPDAPFTEDAPLQRTLEGLAIGAGVPYTSACLYRTRVPAECRLVRTSLSWHTAAR